MDSSQPSHPIKRVVAGVLAFFLFGATLLSTGIAIAAFAERHWKLAVLSLMPLASLPVALAFAIVAIKGREPQFLADDN